MPIAAPAPMASLLLLLLAGQAHADLSDPCDPVPFTAETICESGTDADEEGTGVDLNKRYAKNFPGGREPETEVDCARRCKEYIDNCGIMNDDTGCCQWNAVNKRCFATLATKTVSDGAGSGWSATMLHKYGQFPGKEACFYGKFIPARTCNSWTRPRDVLPVKFDYGKNDDKFTSAENVKWAIKRCAQMCSEAGSKHTCCQWNIASGLCIATAATETMVSVGDNWHATMLSPDMYECDEFARATVCDHTLKEPKDEHGESYARTDRVLNAVEGGFSDWDKTTCLAQCNSAAPTTHRCCMWNEATKKCSATAATQTMAHGIWPSNWWATMRSVDGACVRGLQSDLESRHARALEVVVGAVQHQLPTSNSTVNKSTAGNTTV